MTGSILFLLICLFILIVRMILDAFSLPLPAPKPASDSRFMKPVQFDPARAERMTSGPVVIMVTFALLALMALLSPILVG